MPVLPAGLTLGVTTSTPPVAFNAKLCCNFNAINVPAIPIGFGLPVGAAIAALVTALGQITSQYVDLLPVACPIQ